MCLMPKDNNSYVNQYLDGNIQVDRLNTEQGTQVMMLESSMATKQRNELPATTENIAVLCQTDTSSDKDLTFIDCWAQEYVVAGGGGQQDDLHHHGAGGHLEPLREPGHVVHDGNGHMRDKPGKDN